MALTSWMNTITGKRLSRTELERMRGRAHRLYEVNGHIFEDELDALNALGVVALFTICPDTIEFAPLPTAPAA